jgi:hypothetical protein
MFHETRSPLKSVCFAAVPPASAQHKTTFECLVRKQKEKLLNFSARVFRVADVEPADCLDTFDDGAGASLL